MQQLADRIEQFQDRAEIEAALDDAEFLMEALDPELQDQACQLAEVLRRKLENTAA